MRIVRTASLRPLKGKRIAILGYGSQGRAQALNMRDVGIEAIIGLPSRGRSRRRAKADGFTVTTPSRAAAQADILFVLAPDHLHEMVYQESIRPHLNDAHVRVLVFAHASSVHFGMVKPPPFVDVVLIAPLGPGKRLRELRAQPDGVPCFLAIHQDSSGCARSIGLALASAIGCLPAGAIETTFAEEAVGDLFGEQAVLCGGLGELLKAGVETLISRGLTPHNAYLECVYQLDLIVDLVKSEGLSGMYRRISPTASYGARKAGPMIVPQASRRAMLQLFKEIESGRFFRSWTKRGGRGLPRHQIDPPVPKEFARAEQEVLKALKPKRQRSK
jgi:ketol-acid reductoisomerase